MNSDDKKQDKAELLKRMQAKVREHFEALDNGTSKPIPPGACYNDGHAIGMADYGRLREEQARLLRQDENRIDPTK